eukprot:scaffold91608_cov19-Tisochrysis_lutea.AAC.1
MQTVQLGFLTKRLNALSQWMADRAVLPIENSLGGSIHAVPKPANWHRPTQAQARRPAYHFERLASLTSLLPTHQQSRMQSTEGCQSKRLTASQKEPGWM